MANTINDSSTFSGSETVRHIGQTCTLDQIREPGCYLVRPTGSLLRVPIEAIQESQRLAINVVSKTPRFCVKIADDPYLSLSRARMAASDLDLPVNF